MRRVNRMGGWVTTLVAVALTVSLLWVACSRKSPMDPTRSLQDEVPLLTNMQASPSQIAVGGAQSVIRVRLIDQDGDPITGRVVTFATSLGSVTSEDSTDAEGWSEAVLTSAGTAGQAKVTASYGGLASAFVWIGFVASHQAQIQMDAEDDEILADGVDETTITVTLLADSARPMIGAVVSLSATAGTVPTSVMTDGSGNGTFSLTSVASDVNTISTVTATYDTLSVAVTVTFMGVTLTAGANPMTILADGKSRSTITVILKETTSHVAVSDATVRFGTDLGTIPGTTTTNTEGLAQVGLTSGTTEGTAHVVVYYGRTFMDTVDVHFSSEAPSIHTLKEIDVSPAMILANGVDQAMVSVSVADNDSEPVSGVVVNFSTTVGQMPSQGITTDNGVATVPLTSTASRTDLTAVVTAQLDTQEVSTTVGFLGVQLERSASPTSIVADGQSTSKIIAVLKQTTSKIAIPNATVSFSTDLGTIPSTGKTNSAGVAEVSLTSGTETGTAHVVVRYGDMISDTVDVLFQASIPAYLDVTATPPVIPADGQTESIIKATVSDATQNPVPDGIPVYFNIIGGSGGTIVNQRATSGGMATSALTSTATGTIRVRVSVGSLADTVNVVCTVGPVDQVLVTSDRDSLAADGIETATIQASVMDAQGNPVSGVTVNFSASIGDITRMAPTNGQGVATASFSSSVVGTATITATVGSVSGGKIIKLLPGGPNSIVLRFNPTSIGVKGTGQTQTAIVEAEVRDSKNNPVIDGTLVRFSILAGPGGGEVLSSEGSIPTVGGIARVSLSSGTVSGNVRVQAEVVSNPVIAIASEILIHAGEPYMEDRNDPSTTHLTVVGRRLNIWVGMDTTRVSIMVLDKYNNPVQEGTAVYLTTSGGGINTHTAYTDAYGKASVILTAGNPLPTIDRFYNYDGMQDPNLDTVIPGYAYYPDLGESLIPNFDAYPDAYYPGTVGGRVLNSEGDLLENDGIARIVAYTEGQDANGDSIRVWDWLSVVYSGPIAYMEDNSAEVLPDTLHPGQSAVVRLNIMDANGNPIACGSTITASLIPEDAQARLSWNSHTTRRDQGTSYYYISIQNAIDAEKPKPGWASIKFSVESVNGVGFISTQPVYISTD